MNYSSLRSKRLAFFITLIALVTALAASLLFAGPTKSALAQGGTGVPCNGLSEDDCAMLHNAQTAMQGMTSVALTDVNFQMHMTAEGESMDMAIRGAGALMLAPALAEFAALMPQSPQAMADMTAVLDIFDKLDETMVQSILTDSAGHMRIDELSMVSPDETVNVQAEIVLKDSTLYLHMTSPNGADAWFGEPVTMADTDLADLRESLDQLREQMASEEFQSTMAQMSEYQSLMTAVSDVVNQHITTTRGEDATLHDQAMATFSTTMDLRGLLSDPALSTALFNMLTSPMFAEAMQGSDVEQLNPAQVQLMMAVVGMMFKNPVITTEQWIGLDDGALHKNASTISLTLDPSVLADSSDTETTPVEMAITMLVEVDPGAEVDPETFPIPDMYNAMEKASGFLPGSPEMIDQEIEFGQSVEAKLIGTEPDIYALNIQANTPGAATLATEGYASMTVYGPDGFNMDKVEGYGGGTSDGMFKVPGMYLIVIEGDADVAYTLTLTAE